MSNNRPVEMKEFRELTAEELDGLAGGLVVSYADGWRNLVIDDATGEWVEEVYNDLDLAIEDARKGGFGDQVIHIADDDYATYAMWLKNSVKPH